MEIRIKGINDCQGQGVVHSEIKVSMHSDCDGGALIDFYPSILNPETCQSLLFDSLEDAYVFFKSCATMAEEILSKVSKSNNCNN